MSQYVIFHKKDLFIAIKYGTSDSKAEFESLSCQEFEICSQPMYASSTDEAVYLYKDNSQLYALDKSNHIAVESTMAAIMSLSLHTLKN